MEQIFTHPLINPCRKIWVLIICVVLLKLTLLPFAQCVDADAVERTMLSEVWLKTPIWITHSFWGPFHFYLNGAFMIFYRNPIYAPVVLNIILSALILLPFYSFTKREFNPEGAFIATCFLAISPILFRNSLMNMSEIPYLLCIIISMNLLSKGLRSGKHISFLLAGLSATIASGFRFEAWAFIPIFLFVILLKKEITNAALFFIAAILYPLIDLIQHFIGDGYSLSGFFTGYPWSLHPNGNPPPPSLEDYLRRLWFFPLCWIISLGPVSFIVIKEIILAKKRRGNFLWTVPFWLFFILTEIASFKGAIILHQRFVISIAALSLPFAAPYFRELSVKKIRMALLFAALTIGLTFVYNMRNITPIPRLTDQNEDKIAKIIQKEITPQSGLIVDFWDWENTYYIGLQSKLSPENIFMYGGDDQDKLPSEEINPIIKNHPQGVILLVKKSFLWQNTIISESHLQFKFNNTNLNTQEIFNNDAVTAWKYSVAP